MPITRAMQVAAFKARVAKKKKLALLASGKNGGSQDSTYARFLSPYRYVPDFAYVEDDGHTLIADAQRRLMWGHRLFTHSRPFEELLIEFEQAVDSQDLPQALLEEKRHRAKENRDVRARIRRYEYTPKKFESVAALPKRKKKLKNRTRDERIADLRLALSRQE